MVVVMIAIMSLFAFPKVIRAFDQSQVKGARLSVLNKFNAARLAARQSSRHVYLIRVADALWIEREPRVTPQGFDTRDTVGGFLNLGGVTMSGTLDTVPIDPRGLTQGGGTWQLNFTRGAANDSLIISGFGTVTR